MLLALRKSGKLPSCDLGGFLTLGLADVQDHLELFTMPPAALGAGTAELAVKVRRGVLSKCDGEQKRL